MKVKVFILAIFMAFSFQVNADVNKLHACQKLYSTSAKVMALRQAGYPMGPIIQKSPDIRVIKNIILAAYNKPIYKSNENKKIAVKTFARNVYIQCIDAASI